MEPNGPLDFILIEKDIENDGQMKLGKLQSHYGKELSYLEQSGKSWRNPLCPKDTQINVNMYFHIMLLLNMNCVKSC